MPYMAGSKCSSEPIRAAPSFACFSESEMRRRSRSMSMTLTRISSPTWTTCSGISTWRSASSEMCTSPSMPSSTRTNAPNGTSLVTRPGTTCPIWWVRANCCHGSSWVDFSDSETRSRSMSTSSTSTVTSWPTSTTSPGWSMCFQDSSDTCTRPSTPPRSTNARKLPIADTAHLHQGGRQEAAQADVQDQAALDDLDHRAGDHAVFFLDLLDRAPGALVLGPLLGQDQAALFVLLLQDKGLDVLAGLDYVMRVDVVLDGQFA